MLRSEACFVEVVFSLAPEFVQVFFKGRRPFWPSFFSPCCLNLFRSSSRVGGLFGQKIYALMPDFGQVFVKVEGLFWLFFAALMPNFGHVFVKVEGLFGHRGRFKLSLPMAGALKGPVVFVYRILRRQSWPLSVLGSLWRSFGELPLYTCRGFLH